MPSSAIISAYQPRTEKTFIVAFCDNRKQTYQILKVKHPSSFIKQNSM